VKAVAPLPRPVALGDAKVVKSLSKMVLVNNTRLSVQPVTESEWSEVCRLGGLAGDP
jgi:predicted RNA-binding protein with PUA-like domain